MTMTSHVSTRGQMTIDRVARKQLGVCPGMIAYQRVVDDHLEVYFLPGPHNRSLFGVLAGPIPGPEVMTRDDVENAVREAIAEDLRQREREDA